MNLTVGDNRAEDLMSELLGLNLLLKFSFRCRSLILRSLQQYLGESWSHMHKAHIFFQERDVIFRYLN